MVPHLKAIFLFLWLLQCGVRGPCAEYAISFLAHASETHSPTNDTCVCTAPSPLRSHHVGTCRCPSGGEDVDVQQNPPIQVALLKEGISIPCKVTFPYIPKYTTFSIIYYWINSLGQKASIYSRSENVAIPSGKENTTATISYDHSIMPLGNTFSTGTYYCEVKWNDIQKMGKGVFVLARDTGFAETSYGWEILVTLTVLLAALSIAATALLLWKRKVLCPRRNQLNILRQKVETQPPPVTPPPPPPPPPSSVYDSLDLQHVDVYSVIENDTNNPSPKKSPPGKTPKKQATLDESCDTLYENI